MGWVFLGILTSESRIIFFAALLPLLAMKLFVCVCVRVKTLYMCVQIYI